MIVRIMGEGQLRLADTHLAELNRLDGVLLGVMDTGDDEGFQKALMALITAVRRLGKPLPDDVLQPSDLILPSPDASLKEVASMLRDNGEGLIPD